MATEDLSNVEVALGVYTPRGEGAAHLWTESSGSTFQRLPRSGTLICRLPRAPLLPGTYTVSVFATVNGILADWVIEAAVIDVAEGDYFGTGKLPPPGYGNVAIDHTWHVDA